MKRHILHLLFMLLVALALNTQLTASSGSPPESSPPPLRETIHATIEKVFRFPHTMQLKVRSKDFLSLAEIRKVVMPLLPPAWAEWTWSGNVDIESALSSNPRSPDPGLDLDLAIQLLDAAFSSPDGANLGTALSARITVHVRTYPQKGQLAFHVELVMTEGELLIGKFYANLKNTPAKGLLEGTYDLHKDSLTIVKGTMDAGKLGSLSYEGEVKDVLTKPFFRLHFSPVDIFNEPVFDAFIKDLFQSEFPVLRDTTVTGKTHLNVNFEGGKNAFRGFGQLVLRDTNLAFGHDDITIRGIQADLPFALSLLSTPSAAPKDRWPIVQTGRIEIEAIEKNPIAITDASFKLRSLTNGFALDEPLSFPFFNGFMEIPSFELRNIGSKDFSIQLSLRLQDIDISELSQAYSRYRIPGMLSGEFSEVTLSHGRLTTEGGIQAQVFGGDVTLDGVSGQEIFSRLRRVAMDVRLQDIDLEQATSAIPFGRITGIVEGHIKDLSFSFGQPEHFELLIQSVPKPRKKRIFEAKAVENILILGSGGPAVLQKGIASFFKTYPYDRIGIYCKLENDVFTLRGTVHERGVEYLVKRPLLAGINVVNRNPQNQILWRDMVRRLQRIFETGGEKPKVMTR